MNGADGSLDQSGDFGRAAKSVDDLICLNIHENDDMRYSQLSQDQNCDNRFCDNHRIIPLGAMTQADLNQRLETAGVKNIEIATLLGISEDKVSKSRSAKSTRRWTAEEFAKLKAFLDRGDDMSSEPDLPLDGIETDYVGIEVLPTYAGAGGGGSGEGAREVSLVPRALVEDILRGRAGNFILINVRGDSMEPDFRNGDQLMVDMRDISPAQPGPFAIWDGEWGEYVVKNVERLAEGRIRMFSSNPKYTPTEVQHEETRIIGRPVWFARRL